MSENLKNIDKLFKQELGKTEMQVPSGAWEAISSKAGIVSSTSIIAAKGIAWAKVLGVTIATVTTIGAGVYIYNQEPNDKITEKNVSIETPSFTDNTKAIDISTGEKDNTTLEIEPSVAQNFVPLKVEKPIVKVDNKISLELVEPPVLPKLIMPLPIEREVKNITKKDIVLTANADNAKNDLVNARPKQEDNQVQVSKNDETKMLRLFPDVFTPNSDGTNDSFYVEIDKPEVFQLIVRTKQGMILFNTLDVNEKWDGKFNGIELPNGEYIASLVYQFGKTDRVITKIKTIELKRTE